jgi:hypothetical protein
VGNLKRRHFGTGNYRTSAICYSYRQIARGEIKECEEQRYNTKLAIVT